MPKLSGLFDSFDNLDQIDISSLSSWIKPTLVPDQLENYLANKILYPQTIPLTELDTKIDLAILREALKHNSLKSQNFLNITLRKMIIPERFLLYIPDLTLLTWAFVDGLLLDRRKKDFSEDLWTVVIADDNDETVGSIILPQFDGKKDTMELKLLGKDYKIKAGSLIVVPCPKDRCEISYKLTSGKIFGKKENALEVYGGRLGLMIDGRS